MIGSKAMKPALCTCRLLLFGKLSWLVVASVCRQAAGLQLPPQITCGEGDKEASACSSGHIQHMQDCVGEAKGLAAPPPQSRVSVLLQQSRQHLT